MNADGTIATVPVCFALAGDRVVSAIDDKPKGTKELVRVRNIHHEPRVTMLFDRWDEEWTRLGWVMVKGLASIKPGGDAAGLAERYAQYREDPPQGPLLVVEPRRVTWWTWE